MTKRFAYRAAMGVAFAVLGTSAALGDVLHSPLGYSVNIPHGWQVNHKIVSYHDQSGSETDMMYAHPVHAMPMFRIEVDPQGKASLEQARAVFPAFVASQYPNFRLADQHYYMLNGVKMLGTRGICPLQGKSMWIDMLFGIKNGKNYTITLLTPADQAAPAEATFGRIIRSIQWSKPAA